MDPTGNASVELWPWFAMSSPSLNDPGRWAEHKVLLLLKARGWTCLAERWRCRYGELDLVMAKQNGVEGRLLVVEVKSRRRCGLDGWGAAACHASKLQRLARAMDCWRMANSWSAQWSLELVVALVPLPPNRKPVRWIRVVDGVNRPG